LGRPAASTLRVHELLQKRPLLSIPAATRELSLSEPTVAKAMEHLVRLGIVREMTGKRRRRVFAYVRYLDVLNLGTEPVRDRR
jgi:Fic family protein